MILNEGFIICNNDIKNSLLRVKNRTFMNYIYMTMEEIMDKLLITVDPKAIFFLKEKYQISYSLAKEYINNLKWIENKKYNNLKLDSMVSIYNALENEGYILSNKLFIHRLRQFPVTFINPDKTKEYFKIKELISRYTKVYEIDLPKNDYLPKVYAFNSMTDESLFVCSEIVKLLEKGVSLNNIYIVGGSDYVYLFKRLAKHYLISFEFPQIKNIMSSDVCNRFLTLCEIEDNFQDILKLLEKNDLYDKIFNLIQKYGLQEKKPQDYIDFFRFQFQNMCFSIKKYNESVKFVGIDHLCDDKDYIFYVGFNNGNAPKIINDNGFLSDKELDILGLSTSVEKNRIAKEKIINLISHRNVILTYKQMNGSDECLPSSLIKELGFEVEEGRIDYGRSKIEDNIRLSSYYDTYIKYNELHDDLARYGLQDIDYQKYDHKYKCINRDILLEKYNLKPLRLAYSNVKLYFACPFSYFADRILGLNEFKPQMAARMGTFAHAVLEDSYDNDFNFKDSVMKHKLELAVDSKDRFFFKQMETILSQLISFNRKHESNSKLDVIKREQHIIVDKVDYLFEGYIDKLMYKIIDDDVYAAIIDYKTGKDVISLENIEDGFHLQLPAYMYLLSKYKDFEGKKLHIIGIYLQKVNIVILDKNKSINQKAEKNFMLQGYSISNTNILGMLDPGYSSSDYIKSMGVAKTTGNFYAYSKVYAPEKQSEMIDLVDTLLDTASKGIHNGDFEISPKMINGKNESCTFCKYKDICFYDDGDIVELTKKPFEERD